MKACILAAGSGTRLRPETQNKPKCLVEVGGTTILGRQLRQLNDVGITEIVIATGAFSEQVEDFVEREFPHNNTTFVFNQEYASTNYIYSLWLARNVLRDSLFLLHGDLVFADEVIGRMAAFPPPDAVAVDPTVPPPPKDFKALIEGGVVRAIGTTIHGSGAVFCQPLYKLSSTTMEAWLEEIGSFISRDVRGVYAEDALNRISGSIQLKPFQLQGALCTEVDTPEDLDNIRQKLM